MLQQEVLSIFSDWSVEINKTIAKSNSICIALLSTNKELIFSNTAFDSLVNKDPIKSFINPTFEQILIMESSTNLIFDGFLTVGDFNAINTSIVAQIFRKNDKILVIGGVDTNQLIKQNNIVHILNRDIGNLQRDLLKKTHTLEHTLKELNKSNAELKLINTTKDKLFSIIAHDLRSPFNGIIGFSDLLINEIKEMSIADVEKFVGIINSSAKNSLTLLDNLLNWAKTQTGQIKHKPQLLQLSTIIQHTIETSSTVVKLKNITLTHHQPISIELLTDENMVRTVLRNLISNAIKFTQVGGIINISAHTINKNVVVTVSDNGVGMSEETSSKLFDISTNITTVGTENEKGSGLGLVLCKEFVVKLGGDIWVESKVGIGSEFKFTLPLITN